MMKHKKTVYFTGDNHRTDQLDSAIKTATYVRDAWIEEHQTEIGKIDNEDIKLTIWNANNTYVIATIQLTYYPK